MDETQEFYEKLGCTLARRYNDRVTFNFFGDQVVCHLHPEEIDPRPKMYPRHFGVTFLERSEYEKLLEYAIQHELPFFQEPMVRFKGRQEEHMTFFLIDPANNLLEFKFYHDESKVY